MRDLLEEAMPATPLDPTEAARRNMRSLRRRFYDTVEVREEGGAYALALDGKAVRTPAGGRLAAPHAALAEILAQEWRAVGEMIDPAGMPLTRLANTIIDGVDAAREALAADIRKYLGSDLIFYRAEGPDGLVARQAAAWDPILRWARDAFGARFILAEGVMFVPQPDTAVAAMAGQIPDDAWRLGATHAVMTLTGSALIALALACGALDPDGAWQAAQVDEDWQSSQWGHDEIAAKRRAFQRAEFDAAAAVLRTL
jgi:chaperone required for assembly of F1-ATPase